MTRYAERLPKRPQKAGTKASAEREASLRRRYPPLDGVTDSKPCIIVDMQGIILAWYLPGILTDYRQVSFLDLSDRLRIIYRPSELNVGRTREVTSIIGGPAKRWSLAQ